MTTSRYHTYNEIVSQPEAWSAAASAVRAQNSEIRKLWSEKPYDQVVFTGCGSTYYLSVAAAALFQELTGVASRAVPAGELVMYPDSAYPAAGDVLMVAVSRSGKTTETIKAVNLFKDRTGSEVVTIQNYPDALDRPLASLGAINLVIPEGQEESVAQTRSFASLYVAATSLAALLAGRDDLLDAIDRLPQAGEKLLQKYGDFARELGEDLTKDRFYFLGSGPRYGLACEANLKMKEMTLTHSEPFHFLEFRHGPMSMVTGSAVVIGLLSKTNRKYEEAVLNEMKNLGGKVVSLADTEAAVSFDSALPEAVINVLYLPFLQLSAYFRSVAKGLNPDRPNNLSAVIELDFD